MSMSAFFMHVFIPRSQYILVLSQTSMFLALHFIILERMSLAFPFVQASTDIPRTL